MGYLLYTQARTQIKSVYCLHQDLKVGTSHQSILDLILMLTHFLKKIFTTIMFYQQ